VPGECEYTQTETGKFRCLRCHHTRHATGLTADRIRRACPRATPAAPRQTIQRAPKHTEGTCLHRGQVLREIGCHNCRGAEIKLPVYDCAIHGECSLRNYRQQAADFATVQVCAGCPNQKPAEPELPSTAKRALHLARDTATDLRAGRDTATDLRAGRPRRSMAEITRLFEAHCRGCPAYNAAAGACSKCGCPVSPDEPEWNRLAWAALGCGHDANPKFGPAATVQSQRTIKTLNLTYHIWPTKQSDAWRWNVEQLLKRIHIFNGRRVIAVALDDLTVPMSAVRAAFAGHAVEFVERANDPRLREVSTFDRLLEQVETLDPSHATFYAHAKGTSRRGNVLTRVIKRWTETMYRENLDDVQRVKKSLATHAMLGVSFSCEPRWRYPGAFWWFHNATVFRDKRWRELDNPISNEGRGWAVEAFPDRMFAADECASIKIDLDAPAGTHRSLYAPEVWGLGCPDTLDAALARFNEQDYLAMYPDVSAGVAAGDWPSGRHHFIAMGFQERRPI
jgi:hypothetical protein